MPRLVVDADAREIHAAIVRDQGAIVLSTIV